MKQVAIFFLILIINWFICIYLCIYIHVFVFVCMGAYVSVKKVLGCEGESFLNVIPRRHYAIIVLKL